MSMSNEQIISYYVGLLIMQYTGQTNVQTITFSGTPASGNFQFTYGTLTSPNVAWNANNSTIIGVLATLTGIPSGSISITGGLSSASLVITLGNSPALILGTTANTLLTGGSVAITTQTSGSLVKAAGHVQALAKLQVMQQLPLLAQNAFNLIPTIQTVTFAAAPVSGSFKLQLAVTSTPTKTATATASIANSATNQQIVNAINAILPSGTVAVTSGSLASGAFTLQFSGVNPTVLTVVNNTTGQSTTVTTNLAVGTQLDVIGKYVGAKRVTSSPAGIITLSDADFYTLIQLAILVNNSGSSLYQIQTLLWNFFQGQILVFDYQNMKMSYVVNTNGISLNVIYAMISQGFLPRPMGVQLANVIAASNTNFFSFRTYLLPASGQPFNTYDSYNLSAPWVSYSNAIG